MDLTPVEATPDFESLEGQDPQAHAEGVLKRRIAALIEKVSSVVFSYIAQVCMNIGIGSHIYLCHACPLLAIGHFSHLRVYVGASNPVPPEP